jgi:hypothetical protein
VNQRTFVFPTRYSVANKYALWNAADDVAGIKLYPKTGDTIKFTNCLFISESRYRWEFDASSATSGWTGDFSGITIVGANVTLQAVFTFSGMKFIDCPVFTLNAAVMQSCTFQGTTVTGGSPGDADNIASSSFTSAGTGHALVVTGTAATMTLSGLTFTDYAASDGSTGNEAIYINIATGSMTINVTNGGTTPSVRTAGCVITKVNARTVRVTAKDANTGSVIQGARVGLWATTGTSVGITRTGSTAYVAHTSHGYQTGQKVVIFGADQGEYNGIKTITYSNANEYTFTVSGTPATPATGTITSHKVILDADTNASGIVEDTAYNYVSDLNVEGRARKGSAATYYKTSPISGTITSAAGFDATIFMVED